jgi:hypothetical protein
MERRLRSSSVAAASLRTSAKLALAAACLLSVGLAGCPPDKKIHAKLPKIIPPVPAVVEPLSPPYILGEEPTDTTLAMIPESLPTPPPGHAHSAPPRKPATDSPVNPKPAVPVISPQISPADQAAYERRISENIGTAERNLQQASAHQLNASQKDMAEKIKAFVDQAREAMQASDWTRAQNLAQKAQVLSAELVNSF